MSFSGNGKKTLFAQNVLKVRAENFDFFGCIFFPNMSRLRYDQNFTGYRIPGADGAELTMGKIIGEFAAVNNSC